MERKSFAGMHCSVAQCLEVVGEWWSMLVLRDVFLGVTRFDDIQQRLGISRNILNQRLSHLVEAGVLERVQYSHRPPRYEYRLTDKGRDLWPVLTAMRQWGDRYAAPDGPPVTHDAQSLWPGCRRGNGVLSVRRRAAVQRHAGGSRAGSGRTSRRVGATVRRGWAAGRVSWDRIGHHLGVAPATGSRRQGAAIGDEHCVAEHGYRCVGRGG